jgi:hypothetical protein
LVHQTTIRFSVDTWAGIEREARAMGVSAAQFVRESAIARLATGSLAAGATPHIDVDDLPGARSALAAQAEAHVALEGSDAVWAQARLARQRAREVRQQARELQFERTAVRR